MKICHKVSAVTPVSNRYTGS